VRFLRTLSTRSILLIGVAATLLVVGGTTIAIAAGGSGPVPPSESLARAVHDGLAAPEPVGVTARIRFTNRLFPTGVLQGQVGSALVSGASGRLWVRDDGRGRLELQSTAGDVQVVWNRKQVTVYDASSDTVYRADLPASKARHPDRTGPLSPAQIEDFLTQLGKHVTLSGAVPSNVAGREAYTVTASPKDKAGLIDSIQVAWDAARGVPLRAAIYAKGSAKPVLALEATDISFGPVPDRNVDVAPPSGARPVEVPARGSHVSRRRGPEPKESVAAGFPITAPRTLLGLPRTAVRVLGEGRSKTALVVYGEGLGSIVIAEQKAGDNGAQLTGLPEVRLDGATGHELTTPLGTILQWRRDGLTYLLAGSVPAATAHSAANGLR
jgi:outer membrane lipoprotein-sorting protein